MIGASDEALRLLGCALAATGSVALVLCSARSPGLKASRRQYHARLADDLRCLQLQLHARHVVKAQFAAAIAAAAAAIAASAVWPLGLIPIAALLPGMWLARSRRQRSAQLERQLDTFLVALANALRANPALAGALATSADLVDPPLSHELDVVLGEHQLGVPIDRGLRNLAERARSPVVSAALAVLRIASATGGDLSQTLETAAASLREMARLEGVVRAKTAEGRAQTAVIACAPLLLVLLLDQLDPALLAPLWTTRAGSAIAAAACALWAVAFVLARKIVAVDV